ncbi:hypothetical protein KC334_g20703, partial [Hortaea werneckii]
MSSFKSTSRAFGALTCRACKRPAVQAKQSLQWQAVRGMSAETQQKLLSSNLEEADPNVFDIIRKEKRRQKNFINLIPSENFTSQAVLDALGSVMQNK